MNFTVMRGLAALPREPARVTAARTAAAPGAPHDAASIPATATFAGLLLGLLGRGAAASAAASAAADDGAATDAGNAAATTPSNDGVATGETPESPAANEPIRTAAAAARETRPAAGAALDTEFTNRLDRVMDRMRREHGHDVRIVEGWRSQTRQDALFQQGRTAPGPVVTWTRNSQHTHGRAVDVVIDGRYDNMAAYAKLAQIAAEEGLRTLGARDPGHIELPRDAAAGASTLNAPVLPFATSNERTAGAPAVGAHAAGPAVAAPARVARTAAVARPARPGHAAPPATQHASAGLHAATDEARRASGAVERSVASDTAHAAQHEHAALIQAAWNAATSHGTRPAAATAVPSHVPAADPDAHTLPRFEPAFSAPVFPRVPTAAGPADGVRTHVPLPSPEPGQPAIGAALHASPVQSAPPPPSAVRPAAVPPVQDVPNAPAPPAHTGGQHVPPALAVAAAAVEARPSRAAEPLERGSVPRTQPVDIAPARGAELHAPLMSQTAPTSLPAVSGMTGSSAPAAAENVSRIMDMIEAQRAATPLQQLRIRLDDAAGGGMIRVGVRNGDVSAVLQPNDPVLAADLARNVDALRTALDRRGLDLESLLVREATRSGAAGIADAPGATGRPAAQQDAQSRGREQHQPHQDAHRRDTESRRQQQQRRK